MRAPTEASLSIGTIARKMNQILCVGLAPYHSATQKEVPETWPTASVTGSPVCGLRLRRASLASLCPHFEIPSSFQADI